MRESIRNNPIFRMVALRWEGLIASIVCIEIFLIENIAVVILGTSVSNDITTYGCKVQYSQGLGIKLCLGNRKR